MKEICFLNKGDNLEKLNYKLGIDKFASSNSDLIQNYRYLTIKEGDDTIQIVRNYNPYYIVNSRYLDKINTMEFDVVNSEGEKIIFKKSSGIKYSVKPLEKIEDVAKKFGVSVDYIIDSNQLNTHKLFVGQMLII